MKERKDRAALPVLWMLILAAAILLTACSEHSDQQNVVFEDMEAAFAQADLRSANIGLFSKTVSKDAVSYGECGSGVIFDKQGDVYYALTAAHVVSGERAQILVFTVNTEMKTDEIPGFDYGVLSQEVYESMYLDSVAHFEKK